MPLRWHPPLMVDSAMVAALCTRTQHFRDCVYTQYGKEDPRCAEHLESEQLSFTEEVHLQSSFAPMY